MEKPILFNTEMVTAILEGRKTSTRRVAKINTEIMCNIGQQHDFVRDDFTNSKYTGYVCRHCGYGVSFPHSKYPVGTSFIRPPHEIGDILYVRETFSYYKIKKPIKAIPADFKDVQYFYKADDLANSDGSTIKWRPSIHMPKAAARIFLKVTDVRVQRVQDITEEEALKEGIKEWTKDGSLYKYCVGEVGDNGNTWRNMPRTAKEAFKNLWDSLYKNWSENPYVWIIEFERVDKKGELKSNERD